MKFGEMVSNLLKSLTNDGKKEEEPAKQDEDEPQLEGGETGEDGADKDKYQDVTDIMKGLVSELADVNKSLKAIISSQGDVGEAVVGVAEMVSRIAKTPIPPKSVMAKGGMTGATGTGWFPSGVKQGADKPTQADFERAQEILVKSFRAGEIDLIKAELISSDMQRAMIVPGHTMKPEYFDFLASKTGTV